MSCKIQTLFAVRDLKIMEDTISRMGYKYEKQNEKLTIKKRYNNIVISEQMVTCDSDNKNEVDKIKIEYGRDLGVSIVEEMGALYQVEETKDEILIYT